MKGIIKFFAVIMISSVVGLQSSYAQLEMASNIPQFNADYEYNDLVSVSTEDWDKIGVVPSDNTLKTSESPKNRIVEKEASFLKEVFVDDVRFLEFEINNQINDLLQEFELEQVKGLQVELMIDVKGQIAKLELVDTDMDRELVKALLHHFEKWTFKYRSGENTRFVLDLI